MEYERYNPKDIQRYYKKKKFGKKTITFFSFLFIIGIILFSAFYDNEGITGNVIKSTNQNNSLNIKTSLSVPEVSLDGDYEEITLSLKKNNFVYLDNKKIILENSKNDIIFKNFKGVIEINENEIKKLDGKISEIKINSIPVSSENGKTIKFSLSPNAEYSFFEIKSNVYLKNVFFIASGNINFEGDSLNLDSEKITFKNYLGNLRIINKKLILEGWVQNLYIEGDSRKISLSKSQL